LQVGTFATRNSIAAWIDFNGDGTFSSEDKLDTTDEMNANDTTTYTFIVPGDATTGATRLRVRETYRAFGTLDPCQRDPNP